ncbi:S8 family serine peptidase [Actinoplanes sp. N902-109]|uniref:S8 family serine peptidase n=1 Tax=Actinoplanes sp. (strain N902-109) TaxID=649831 RepID=UPI0003295F37|nr:S8 family serine peptidase [Actinoplanes sp. N902-109]AGL14534.1 peptidase S8/S53 subtilisin kexin sedolisin [Actinoplanes sp. N902-109]
MILRALTAGLLAIPGSPAVAASDPAPFVVGLRDGSSYAADLPAREADRLLDDPAVEYVEPDHVARIDTAGQWSITRTGVDAAWQVTRGRGTVTVAVVDTGVSAIPELAGRLLPGHDFVDNDNDAGDDNGHGTMAAGVLAAAATNRSGVVGICPACKILPVKVLGADGSGSYSTIADGIRWAADQDARIISLSLGGDADSQVLRDAVGYAADRGALVIAAAGNEGSSTPHYPAAIPSVLAVGGSTDADLPYPWSNYGSDWVDIAAPGCNLAPSRDSIVGQFCGTSSATPFVAGVAALLASQAPARDATRIRDALTSTADPVPGGWVPGRINAARAIAVDDTVKPVTAFLSPGGSALVRGTVAVSARATDNIGIAKVELFVNGKPVGTDRVSPYVVSWRSSGTTATLRLRTTDLNGNVSTATRTVTVDNIAPAVRMTVGSKVKVTATDRIGIRRIQLLANGTIVRRSTGATATFTVPRGTTSIRVRAYDRTGNATTTPARRWRR